MDKRITVRQKGGIKYSEHLGEFLRGRGGLDSIHVHLI